MTHPLRKGTSVLFRIGDHFGRAVVERVEQEAHTGNRGKHHPWKYLLRTQDGAYIVRTEYSIELA